MWPGDFSHSKRPKLPVSAPRIVSHALPGACLGHVSSRQTRREIKMNAVAEIQAMRVNTYDGTSPQEAVRFIRDKGAQIVDIRFTDLLGTWQHFSIPATHFTEDAFVDGLPFDGSSIRGFQSINESDM